MLACSFDDIAAKWRTAGSRRRGAKAHLCILLAPMAYMLANITFEADADDYKEMSGGIIALVFTLVQFARTVVELRQLHVFRHWIIASVRSLESRGYVAQENDGDDDIVDRDEERGSAQEKKARQSIGPRNLFTIADNVVVNDLVVDRKLSNGEVECLLRVRSGEERRSWKATTSDWLRSFSCVVYFPRLLVAVWRSREPRFSSPISFFHLEPVEPEDVYMKWACVLVAQVFPQWLEDMKHSGMSDMSSNDRLS